MNEAVVKVVLMCGFLFEAVSEVVIRVPMGYLCEIVFKELVVMIIAGFANFGKITKF